MYFYCADAQATMCVSCFLFSIEECHCRFAEVSCVGKDVTACNESVGVVHQLAYCGNRNVTTCKFCCSRPTGCV